MIHVDPVPKPEGFVERAEQPGAAWLAEHSDAKRPRDYWSPFKPALAAGFRDLCAYSAMYEPSGTVDHFVSWDEDRSKAYDWNNYRFASAWINSSKQKLRSTEILDPYEVQEGWFEVRLPSLQLHVSDTLPETHRERAERCLSRLHLRSDERVIRQRRAWYRMYQEGKVTLDGLAEKAPLIAAAVRKQAAPVS